MGLSDSRQNNAGYSFPDCLCSAGLPGSSTVFPRALPPTTPKSPVTASARCFTVDPRLHLLGLTGHSQLRNEAESGSLALRLASLPCKASQRDHHFPRLLGYLPNRQLQDKLLSAYEISQAFPGASQGAKSIWRVDLRKLINFSPSHTAHSVRLASQTSGPRLLLLNFRLG